MLLNEKGRFFIKDLEQMEEDKANEKIKKRRHAETAGYGRGEEIDSDIEEEEMRKLQGKIKDSRSISKDPSNKFKAANPPVMRKRDAKQQGHIVKSSANLYTSKKGKGDVLKAGTHEPYAYIKLNPEMLNPRKKSQAVASFAGVVSHGKKVDKRTMKRKEGMLAGMSAKQ